MINHVRNVSLNLLKFPGLTVSVDVIMVRCTGRSAETHRMRNKLISEGYKLFTRCDSKSGYIDYFTTDGVQASSKSGNEFLQRSSEGAKIYNMIMFLYDSVLTMRVSQGTSFVLFVDNYFSVPRTIAKFRR